MKNLPVFAYAWLVIVGGMMFVITKDGILKICIACNHPLINVLAAVSIVLGAIGLARAFSAKEQVQARF